MTIGMPEPDPAIDALMIARAHLNHRRQTVITMVGTIPAPLLVGGLLELNRTLAKMALGGGIDLPDDDPANTAALDAYGFWLRDALAELRAAGGEGVSFDSE